MTREALSDYTNLRYGLFVHYGLFSSLARGEWVMNRENISPAEMRSVGMRLTTPAFDAESIADLAVDSGMRYIVFTTMHHEGFRMYDTELTDFCSTRLGPKRDFVDEIIKAARKRNLKIGLYHSLNNWYDQPDAVAALESQAAYEEFIDQTFRRIRELVTRYNPIDILWYDGWWPFNAKGWQAERMNAMVREIQPQILFNGRNGLPGDFATPEQHLTAPDPWRPWEACMTLNDNWGFHAGDHNWKSPIDVIKSLVRVAQGKGNLLLNIGPRGDGSIPEESVHILRTVGNWLRTNAECLTDTDLWTIDPYGKGDHRGDWIKHGYFTASGNTLYLIATCLPKGQIIFSGLAARIEEVQQLGSGPLKFSQDEDKVSIQEPIRDQQPGNLPPVLRIRCDRPPSIYKTGGMRVPAVNHPRYDPIPSDISW